VQLRQLPRGSLNLIARVFPQTPAVFRNEERLPGMLEAVSHFAIGGTRALEALAQSDDEAALLLEHSALPHTN
jgi:hypothetical protein